MVVFCGGQRAYSCEACPRHWCYGQCTWINHACQETKYVPVKSSYSPSYIVETPEKNYYDYNYEYYEYDK